MSFVKFGKKFISKNSIVSVNIQKSNGMEKWRVQIKTTSSYHPYVISRQYSDKKDAEKRLEQFFSDFFDPLDNVSKLNTIDNLKKLRQKNLESLSEYRESPEVAKSYEFYAVKNLEKLGWYKEMEYGFIGEHKIDEFIVHEIEDENGERRKLNDEEKQLALAIGFQVVNENKDF